MRTPVLTFHQLAEQTGDKRIAAAGRIQGLNFESGQHAVTPGTVKIASLGAQGDHNQLWTAGN